MLIDFSDTVEGAVTFRYARNVTSAVAELWDTGLKSPEEVWNIPSADIESGVFTLPTVNVTDIFFAHMDHYMKKNTEPHLELRVKVVYDAGKGEQTISLTRAAAPEQGWSFRYWSPSGRKTEYTFPGQFVFRTYSSPVQARVVLDEPALAAEGAISIRVEVNGVVVTDADCEIRTQEDGGYYDTLAVISLPAVVTAGSGTARITVTQPLAGYGGRVWETVREIEW